MGREPPVWDHLSSNRHGVFQLCLRNCKSTPRLFAESARHGHPRGNKRLSAGRNNQLPAERLKGEIGVMSLVTPAVKAQSGVVDRQRIKCHEGHRRFLTRRL